MHRLPVVRLMEPFEADLFALRLGLHFVLVLDRLVRFVDILVLPGLCHFREDVILAHRHG